MRVCLCARAFTTYTMWVSGHSSFGERTVNQQKNSENIAGKDETLKKNHIKKITLYLTSLILELADY